MMLRPYQQRAVESVIDHVRFGRSTRPLVVMPTGSGKSHVIASLATRSTGRVLIVTHVAELVQQNAEKLAGITEDVGIYCAGLNRRDRESKIVVASIQSIYQRTDLGEFRHVVIDEAHRISPDDGTMYRRLFDSVNPSSVIGLTATPHRLGSGLIYGPGEMFDCVAADVGIAELVADGYLASLTTAMSCHTPDFESVRKRQGDFASNEASELMSSDGLIESCCSQTLRELEKRRAGLVFCTDVEHAQKVQVEFERQGEHCGLITGDMPKQERKSTIEAIRGGSLSLVANVNVLATGFDVPHIDLLSLMRPTVSPSLYAQMLGRGMRIADGKTDCLVLDFAGNIKRHGPVDAIDYQSPVKKQGDMPAKTCRACKVDIPISARTCPLCGGEIATPKLDQDDKHGSVASRKAVMGGRVEHCDVFAVSYERFQKFGKPPTLRIAYQTSAGGVSQFVPIESANPKAKYVVHAWWATIGTGKPPNTVDEAIVRQHEIAKPDVVRLTYTPENKWPKVQPIINVAHLA